MGVFQGNFMLGNKILILTAFAAVMALFAICPANAHADLPQTNTTNLQLPDNGGVIPEEKPSPPVETWTGKVKIAGVVKRIDTTVSSKPIVEGSKAIVYQGMAYAPKAAPKIVKAVIWTGNKIRNLPYVWGGGHGSWIASGYDCSGSVSYALHGAGLLKTTMTSGDLASWGKSGAGKWITIYANGGHVYMHVAGVRFDTSGANPSRWQSDLRPSSSYALRHPKNL
jgi:cell wall-associated NlpC family hydrolase